MFQPKISQMTTLIHIQNPVEENVNGATRKAYVDADPPTAWCNWRSTSGMDTIQSGILGAEDTAVVTMYYRADVNLKTHLELNGSGYDILSLGDVEQRHKYLILSVRRMMNK